LGIRPKLQNKYFVTRCIDGDVNVYSANQHPDRVFSLPNVDQEEQSNVQDTQRESYKEEVLSPPLPEENKSEAGSGDAGDEVEESGEESVDSEGNPKKKAKIVEPVVVKKDKSNRISSDKDQMIEIEWNSQIQESSTIMCFANYREAFVNVSIIDIKTRRKNNLLQLQLKASPTKLHQIDPCNLLVGTEGGKIEHWRIDGEGSLVKTYDAHPESTAGISVIMEILSKDPLIRGE